MTFLDTTMDVPRGGGDAVDIPVGDLTVRFVGDPEAGPHVLTIDVRGKLRRRLVSYWDGRAYRLSRRSVSAGRD